MHTPSAGTLSFDFGASNSAMAWTTIQDLAQPIAVDRQLMSMSTAVLFNSEGQRTHVGCDAITEYRAGTKGRLMRSFKSLLGSPLIHEPFIAR